MTAGLEARRLCKNYGGLRVASDISMTLRPGDRTALIGPNGAGKSTFAGLVSGLVSPSSGQVLLDGRDISALSEALRVRAGIVRTFQITSLLNTLSPRQHLRLAILEREGKSARLFAAADGFAAIEAEIERMLAEFGLAGCADRPVDKLAYGEQRLVEFALALAMKPRILLLDEPAAGVPSSESAVILDAILRLPADIGVLIIEHDMDLVFRVASRIVVLVAGAILTIGTPVEIAADPAVRQVYLGTADDA